MAKKRPLTDEELTELVAYLDGELDAESGRALEAKLGLDANVRGEAEALSRTWSMLDFLPRAQASTSFASRTVERVSTLRGAVVGGASGRRRPWILVVGWAVAVLVAGTIGFESAHLARPKLPVLSSVTDPAEVDEQMARDLRLLENKRLYEQIGDMNFLQSLDDPDLFGDEG